MKLIIFKTGPESELTKGEAQVLVNHSLLDRWQITGTVDLQVRRTADTPVCVTSDKKAGVSICSEYSQLPSTPRRCSLPLSELCSLVMIR